MYKRTSLFQFNSDVSSLYSKSIHNKKRNKKRETSLKVFVEFITFLEVHNHCCNNTTDNRLETCA